MEPYRLTPGAAWFTFIGRSRRVAYVMTGKRSARQTSRLTGSVRVRHARPFGCSALVIRKASISRPTLICGLCGMLALTFGAGASRAAEGRSAGLSAAPGIVSLVELVPAPIPFPIIKSEFIFEKAPFASCHASTIAETPNGLVAAWFGGSAEGRPDVGIWLSRFDGRAWSAPVEVAAGSGPAGERVPCWNPVLYQAPRGPLKLFFKAGPSPSRWWGLLTASGDSGLTWAPPRRLPDGILGPVKNKPVSLPDGRLLCPSSTEDGGWRVHIEWTPDFGLTWTKTGPLNAPKEFDAIQPAALLYSGGRIQLLCRSRQGRITVCWSLDRGKTWQRMRATALPNPNSGIDAVTLRDGRQVLVYNPSTSGRTPLAVADSTNGREWKTAAVLESGPGEFSYPAVIQTADGLVHVTYTWRRERIKHVVLDPGRPASSPKSAAQFKRKSSIRLGSWEGLKSLVFARKTRS